MAGAGSGGTRHTADLLVVVLLVVLAGCSDGFTGSAGVPTDATVTPAPVPTDAAPEEPFPPGMSAIGVIDASRLEATHLRTLENATFVERARTTVRLEDGSIAIEEVYLGRHGTNATHVVLRRSGTTRYPVPDRSLVEASVWENESFGIHRVLTTNGQVDLDAFDAPGIFYRRPRGGYGLAFEDGETVFQSRRVVNGSVEYVLVVEGIDAHGPWYYRDAFMRLRDDGRARAVVTSRGTIRRFVVEFPIVLEDRNATLRHTYTVEVGDVTVTRPWWFEEAVTRGAPPPPPSVSRVHHSRGMLEATESTLLHTPRQS